MTNQLKTVDVVCRSSLEWILWLPHFPTSGIRVGGLGPLGETGVLGKCCTLTLVGAVISKSRALTLLDVALRGVKKRFCWISQYENVKDRWSETKRS